MNTIDIGLTWKAAMEILIMGLENGTDEGKRMARTELREIAEHLDEAYQPFPPAALPGNAPDLPTSPAQVVTPTSTDRLRIDWERGVIDKLILCFEISNGDAQGLVEAQPEIMARMLSEGASITRTAQAINDCSKVVVDPAEYRGNDYGAGGGEL